MAIIDYSDNIARDTNVYPPNVYYDDMPGGSCSTVWYDSVEQARAVTQAWIAARGKAPSGYDSGLCAECACSYSFSSPLYHELEGYRCFPWKAAVARGEIAPISDKD